MRGTHKRWLARFILTVASVVFVGVFFGSIAYTQGWKMLLLSIGVTVVFMTVVWTVSWAIMNLDGDE